MNNNFNISNCEKLGLGYLDDARINYVVLLKLDDDYYKLEFSDVNKNCFLSEIPQRITKQYAIKLIKKSGLYLSAPEIKKFVGDDISE